MNENGFNTMRTIVDIGLLTEKAKRQVRDMDDEYTELKKKLAVMVDMARVNADRVDALVNAVQHMDANAVTGEAPTGKAIVMYDDYSRLVELAWSMINGTPIDNNTHLSGWATLNALHEANLAAAMRLLEEAYSDNVQRALCSDPWYDHTADFLLANGSTCQALEWRDKLEQETP